MKNSKYLLLVLATFFLTQNISAQMFVSPASYVYVADNYVYVKQDVNLQNTGNIYLRNQSQFLQGTTTTSTNVGAGKLSVFQEGSVNNFQYNYWCSPVGNASGLAGNESFGITMLNQPVDKTNSTAASTISLSGHNGISNPLKIEPYWIWKYITSNTYDPGGTGWIHVLAASTLAAGQGFTMKGTSGTDSTIADTTEDSDPVTAGYQPFYNNSGANLPLASGRQRYDFRGKPNDGNITINVDVNKFTLTGNPYPSAIDLTAFLTNATNSTGIAYFWDHDKTTTNHILTDYRGGYGTFSPISRGGTGIYVPASYYAYNNLGGQIPGITGTGFNHERLFCPIGQGFMIEGNTLGTVVMSNSYRVFKKEKASNFSEFEKNNNHAIVTSNFLPETPSVSGFDYTTVSTLPVPQIKFNTIINTQMLSQMVLAFDANATDGVDFAMDAKNGNVGTSEEISFLLNNDSYVIDVINFDENKKIPIVLKNIAPANFKISVNEILNFNEAQNVYIHDKDNDTFHDIKNGVYNVDIPAGENTTRFEITFLESNLNITNNSTNDFVILQNNTTQNLTIANPKSVDLKEVSLFDISGKLIFSKSKLGNNTNYQFSTSGLSDGVYIAKLITTEGLKQGTKISVYKTK